MRLLPLCFLLLAGCPQDRIDIVGADADGDGFHSGIDCDDADDTVSPGATEIAYNGVDDDCDETTVDDDIDGDGFAVADDCADDDARRFPGATEVCNGLDDDCDLTDDDGLLSTWYADVDGDGYGDHEAPFPRCDGGSGDFVRNDLDCDDAHDTVHPGADEECNDVDDDCDEAIDTDAVFVPTWYRDADGDLFGDAADLVSGCDAPAGYVANADDCDDTPSTGATVNPGADETCNGIDDDCDTRIDADAVGAATFFFDHDGDGFGTPTRTTVACASPDVERWVDNDDDCFDFLAGAHPGGTELCNGIDDDCDGTPDDTPVDRTTWHADADGDGFGDASLASLRCDDGGGAFVVNAIDCDDDAGTGAAIHPGATETCDGVDNDCNGIDDDVPTAQIRFLDFDEDGYGDPFFAVAACDDPSDLTVTYVSDSSDCDDEDEDVNPDETESCDGIDEDCDGLVDESAAPLSSWFLDADGDGHGDDAVAIQGCSAPTADFVAPQDDCDDEDPAIHPGATQTCSLVDTDCNQALPTRTGCTWGTTCADVLERFPSWSGTDANFLLDPEGDGGPVQFFCDMTDSADRPGAGWMRILQQTFEDSQVGGWQWDPSGVTSVSAAVVTTCTGANSFGKILTMPSNSTTSGGVLFRSVGSFPHEEAWITLDYLMIDTWDGEFGYLSALVEPDDYSYILWSDDHAAPGTLAGCGQATLDTKIAVAEHVTTLGPTPLEIDIGSTLDQAPNDEAFGFDNIEVWIR